MADTHEIKRKPCPFCGNADLQKDDRTGRVHCLKCGADGPVVPYAPDPMFWTWNTRAALEGREQDEPLPSQVRPDRPVKPLGLMSRDQV